MCARFPSNRFTDLRGEKMILMHMMAIIMPFPYHARRRGEDVRMPLVQICGIFPLRGAAIAASL